jgi:hypothetical protein
LNLSSRQRMLLALDRQQPDHTPCSFMLFGGLWSVSASYLSFVQGLLDLGLDAYVQIPPREPRLMNDFYNLYGLAVNYHPQVCIEERVENRPDERYPILVKQYHTPAGTLRAEVRRTEDWRHGNHVPFLDDYLSSRSLKFLVEGPEDLDKLAYLLVSPTPEETAAFQSLSRPSIDFARQKDLLLAGGWGVGADMFGWVYGLQNMLYAVYDQPDLIRQMLDLFAGWNRSRMEVVLSAGVDLYIKRAWYENCDFWSPAKFQEFLAPILKSEADLAHGHGARFGYLITANCMPLLDLIAGCGVDVIIGVDPMTYNLDQTKKILAGRVGLWGGVNGHLTVERGTPEEVRQEVRQAMHLLAPGGGFILSPVDNVRDLTPQSRKNVLALVDEWQKLTAG